MRKFIRYINQLINRIRNGPAQTRARRHQVSPVHSNTAFPSPPSPAHPESPILTDPRPGGSSINHARPRIGGELANQGRCLIDMLPDDALLAIFDFCAREKKVVTREELEAWQNLAHVCRRWRTVVFGSPRRLHLQLVCTTRTPARNTLDVWPALPLVISVHASSIRSVDDIVAVLEQSNRVRRIDLIDVSSSDLEKASAAMQVPFPELTHLTLKLEKLGDELETVAALPDLFLGGSAPRLRFLYFRGIPFPSLPKLLLSATHLVTLRLFDIPHLGYFSPMAIVAALSALTSLGSLQLEFQSPRSHPDWTRRAPATRFVLPVLTFFSFKGVSEYLDDLVARIDAPRLNSSDITFFNQIAFDTPQFIQFVSRTPTLEALEIARVTFQDGIACVNLKTSRHQGLNVRVPCKELDWQVSSLEQVCSSCLPPLPTLEDLYISEYLFWIPEWKDNIENMLWLDLLRPFTAVKNLYLSEDFARRILPALQELVGVRALEVLPILQNVFLAGPDPSQPVQEGIEQFASTRQVISRPIAVSLWDRGSSWIE